MPIRIDPVHLKWIEAKNATEKAQEALNTAAKRFAEAYENYGIARRHEKHLRERVRKKLQKEDR